MEQKRSRKMERKIERFFLGLSLENTTMLTGCERNETFAVALEM